MSRRSIHAFLDRPVPHDVITTVLRTAARAPSGGNLQPWIVHTVEGERLKSLKALMRRRCSEAPEGEPMAVPFFPDDLTPVQRERRTRNAAMLYEAFGADGQDPVGRRTLVYDNFQFFGAPFGLFLFMDSRFGPPQWLDLGLYLQNVMLLLREAGLDSCQQGCWTMFEGTIKGFLTAPSDLILIGGMAIGYRDPDAPINAIVTERDDPLTSFGPAADASRD